MSPLMEDELADMKQVKGTTSLNLTPMTLFLMAGIDEIHSKH